MEIVGLGFHFEEVPIGRKFQTIGRTITDADITNFIIDSLNEGRTEKMWEDSTIKRQTSYLIGCCVDFGLLDYTSNNI